MVASALFIASPDVLTTTLTDTMLPAETLAGLGEKDKVAARASAVKDSIEAMNRNRKTKYLCLNLLISTNIFFVSFYYPKKNPNNKYYRENYKEIERNT